VGHPIGSLPAIYSNGNAELAVFGTGGYVDPLTSVVAAAQQDLISVNLGTTALHPTTELTVTAAGGFAHALTAGQDVFAQVLIVGTQAFVTTSTEDVNLTGYGTHGDTGKVSVADLTTAAGTTTVFQTATRGGASSLASVGTTLIGSSADKQQSMTTTATTTVGPVVTTEETGHTTRNLWLRTL
jgi:hypothetical protein